MAKILTEEVLKALKKFDLPKGYQRTGEFPLDPSSIFSSKADADLYAAGGADSRGLSGTRYAGQLIAVVEGGVTTLYTVEANDTLKAVGGDVTADLADLTSKVNAILNGATIDSFKDVEDALAALPKDMVVSGGEVRKPTTDEVAADATLDATKEYIILTIKNAEEGKDKLFVAADALVDVYTGSDYITITDHKVEANIPAIEAKLVADDFAKKTDITTITDTLATKESLNEVKSTADAAAAKADSNEGKIGTLENVVGKAAEGENPATGLVKEIADIKVSVIKNTEDIATKAAQDDLDKAVARITAVEKSASDNATEISNVKKNVSDLSAKIDAIEIPVKGVDDAASNGVKLGLSDEGKVTVSVVASDVAAAVKPELDLKTTDVKSSAAIGNYAADSTVQSILAGLDARVTTNASSIEAAVAGGVVAVGAGDGISVDASKTTQPVVSVKLASDGNLRFNDNKELDFIWLGDAD